MMKNELEEGGGYSWAFSYLRTQDTAVNDFFANLVLEKKRAARANIIRCIGPRHSSSCDIGVTHACK